MPKPSEFLIGILDFFAIVLPGAIAMAMIRGLDNLSSTSIIFESLSVPKDGGGEWAIFMTLSYLLGHLIFLVGSLLDKIYVHIYNAVIKDREAEPLHFAEQLREKYLQKISKKAINTFQWSRSVLIACAPAAAADVHRLEADSKFFRSIVVMATFGTIMYACNGNAMSFGISIVVGIMCFWRYFERRRKMTRMAYIHVLTLHHLGKLSSYDQTNVRDA